MPDRYVGWKKLQLRWSKTPRETPYAGASVSALKGLEKKYSISVPPDFREYILKTIPVAGTYCFDDDYIEWWSIDRFKNMPDECGYESDIPEIAASASNYIFFADFLMWSCAWAICCEFGPHYGKIVVVGDKDKFVSDSFEEFVEKSLSDIDVLSLF